MEWVDVYVLRPLPAREKTLLQNLKSLTINEDEAIDSESPPVAKELQPKLESFDQFSFISSLQRQFKESGFTVQPSVPIEQSGVLLDFTLLLGTQYEQWQISVSVEINMRLQYIRYQSHPLRGYQLLSFGRDQINTIGKYLSINFNPKNPLGCMSIDVESGMLLYQVVNNSLGHLQRRIRKAPTELIYFIEAEIRQIEKAWRNFLPGFLGAMSIPAVRAKSHAFWRSYKEKRPLYESQQFCLMTEYIKQSYIEHPFMFEQQQMVNGVKVLKKIRSRFLTREEKNKKKTDYDKMMSNKNYYSYRLTNDFTNMLHAFTSPSAVDDQAKRRKYQIAEEKKVELTTHMVVDNFQSRHPLYSPLAIRQVRKESQLTRSGFSQLKLVHLLAKRVEDQQFNIHPIVCKETQPSRFTNQTQILNHIREGKSLFITRFFFSDAVVGNGFNDKILLEYCPLKSIDSYLQANKRYITLQTKLFFLYEIAVGLRFLRDYGIIHNDLKPQNVLLKIMSDRNKANSTFMLRLIDFGQSYSAFQAHLNRTNRYKRGFTIPYAAPQQTRSQPRFTEKIDIFAFGVMMYEIVFDVFPVQVMRKGKEVYMSEENYLKFYSMAPEKCKYYCLPKKMQVLYHLCLRCLSSRPSQRPVIDWVVAILRETLLFGEKIYQY